MSVSVGKPLGTELNLGRFVGDNDAWLYVGEPKSSILVILFAILGLVGFMPRASFVSFRSFIFCRNGEL